MPLKQPPVLRLKAALMPRAPRAKQLGVTDEQYERLLAAQGGGCAICGATPKTRRLHVDHDHKTGAVRGLLCYRCNRFLHGWMTAQWLNRAGAYLCGITHLHDYRFLSEGRQRARQRLYKWRKVLDEINGARQDGKP